jgi:hypothetical protein
MNGGMAAEEDKMAKKVLTPEAAGHIRRMREQVDGWGDPLHSAQAIALELGVSESTVWRVIKQTAAYSGRAAVVTGRAAMLQALETVAKNAEPTEEAIAASQERFLALLQKETKEERQPPKSFETLSPAMQQKFKDYTHE